jgi:hypothetical protein
VKLEVFVMPATMVHLAIARKYAENRTNLFNSPEYYLGSIAPDAMYMRKTLDTLKQKDDIHFKENGKWRIDYLKNFYNSYKDSSINITHLIEG